MRSPVDVDRELLEKWDFLEVEVNIYNCFVDEIFELGFSRIFIVISPFSGVCIADFIMIKKAMHDRHPEIELLRIIEAEKNT